jgi:putative flippase GtrA
VISIDGLHQRFRLLIHEGFKFLVVGGIGAVVTIVGAVALHGLGKYLAITIVTIVGTVVTFLGNRYWAFRHRQGQGATRESVMFFFLNGVGLLIYYACIWTIQGLAGLDGRAWYAVALVLGMGLGTVFRFWSYRRWVWTLQHQPSTGGAALPEFVDPVLAASVRASPVQDIRPMPVRIPSGRATARHAAIRRAPSRHTPVRSRPGAHRRT